MPFHIKPRTGSMSSRLLLDPLVLLLYFISSVFSNAANYFERLGVQLVMASTGVNSSSSSTTASTGMNSASSSTTASTGVNSASSSTTASTGVKSASSSTTIQIYKEDNWIENKPLHLRFNPASNPPKILKITRAGRVVETVDILTPPKAFFTAGPARIDIQRGIGPILSQLPGELRNIIYAYLLCNGHCQFLRASKALHREGSALMAKNGVYRMGFTLGFVDRPNYRLPSQRIADTIRNLSIHINGGFHCSSRREVGQIPDLWLLRAFGGGGVVRGRCDVFFEVHRATNTLDMAILSSCLRLLSDFETVAVWPKINWGNYVSWANGPSDALLVRTSTDWPIVCKVRPIPWIGFKYMYFFKTLDLERSLGKGTPKWRGGMRVVMHPRKALEDAERT